LGLWSPNHETAQGIGEVLGAHWVAAKKAAASSPFFRRSANWLEVSRQHLTLGGGLVRYASGYAATLNPVRGSKR
jgi:hypothetical protein